MKIRRASIFLASAARSLAPVMVAGIAVVPVAALAQQKVPPSAALQSCSVGNAECQLDSYSGWFVGAAESARIEQFNASAVKPSVKAEERLAADGRTKVYVFKGANGKYLAVQPNKNWEVNFVATSPDDRSAQFVAVSALESPPGQNFTSFTSLLDPNRFLRHEGFKLYAHVKAETSLFRRDASWRVLNAAAINTPAVLNAKADAAQPPKPAATARPAGTAPAQADGPDVFALSVPRTQPPLAKLTSASSKADAARTGRVAFVSSDGSALWRSRTVFILRNIASGETILVPVDGNGASTRSEVYVRPGTYEVTPPAPSMDDLRSYHTSKISASRVTVAAGGAPAIVNFSLGVKTAPVGIHTAEVTADTVALRWEALPDVKVLGYTLVRTDGDKEAASETGGVVVARGPANVTSAVAKGLAANRKYTFTLFAKSSDGSALPKRSITVSTARQTDTTQSSYALAPNTIVADNFASLRVEPVSETSVRVALPATIKRGSSSAMPGVPAAALTGNGCVVGTPFLVTTDVAGNNSFYGLIDACEGPPTGATSAIINRNVPLSSVFDYFMLNSGGDSDCFDATTGKALPKDTQRCTGDPDADADADATVPGGAAAMQAPRASDAAPAEGAAAPRNGPTLPFASQTNLVRGQRYWSQSGTHYLVFQPDGNLVVYRADGGYVWGLDRQPNTDFQRIARVTWQSDGNLAAYTADNQWIWSALNSNPDPSAKLVINPQGVLQIVAGTRVMWSASIPTSASAGDYQIGPSTPALAQATVQYPDMYPAFAPALVSAGIGLLPDGPLFPAASLQRASLGNYSANDAAPWMMQKASFAGAASVQPSLQPQRLNGSMALASAATGSWPQYDNRRPFDPGSIGMDDAAGYSPAAVPLAFAAGSPVSCEGSGSRSFSLAPDIKAMKEISFKVKDYSLTWTLKAGVSAGFTPSVEVNGKFACSLKMPEVSIPVGGGAAIPLVLTLAPAISAEASASLKLKGPSARIEIGINSTGSVGFEDRKLKFDHKTTPIASLRTRSATANLNGTLTFRAGVDAALSFGYDLGIVEAKAGLKVNLSPLSAELKAQVGTSTCAAASLGYQFDAKLVADVYIPIFPDIEAEYPLYESGHKPYPRGDFTIGDCGDDDDDDAPKPVVRPKRKQ